MHAIATSMFGRRHGGAVTLENRVLTEAPSEVRDTNTGDARLTLARRRIALDAAGIY